MAGEALPCVLFVDSNFEATERSGENADGSQHLGKNKMGWEEWDNIEP